jgi:hypothetical protein
MRLTGQQLAYLRRLYKACGPKPWPCTESRTVARAIGAKEDERMDIEDALAHRGSGHRGADRRGQEAGSPMKDAREGWSEADRCLMLSGHQGQVSSDALPADRQPFVRPWTRVERCGSPTVDATSDGTIADRRSLIAFAHDGPERRRR